MSTVRHANPRAYFLQLLATTALLPVHMQSLPFRFSPENLARYRADEHMPFWKNLKEGADHFDVTKREPQVSVCNARYTFGLGGASILAALANAMLLFIACGAIGWEALHRFAAPPAVPGLTITVIAVIGIVVNVASAALFFRDRKNDLNIRGAYLHMMADAAVSLGVAIAGVAIFYTHWYWLDPAISLVIVVVIIAGTWGLMRESIGLALNAVPAAVNAAAVEKYLRQLPGVADVHDLHIWGLSTTESALTVHLAMPAGHPGRCGDGCHRL